MLRARFRWMLVLSTALMMQSHLAFAQPLTILGNWTGTAAQNEGKSNYTVVITITSTGAETNYPELNCGGKLKRVGSANGYVFYTETITRGGKKQWRGVYRWSRDRGTRRYKFGLGLGRKLRRQSLRRLELLVATLGYHDCAILQEIVRYGNGLIEQSTRVVAQIDDVAFQLVAD